LDDIIDHTLSLIRTIISKDQINLEVNVEENLGEVECKDQQIQQVLMNLMTNARDALNEKYSGFDNDKKLIVSCKSMTTKDCRKVRIKVEDHGNGISKEVQEKIFEPFFSTKERYKGTGLGLSISYGIIQDHGGKIYFETEEGKYTKFFVELPIIENEDQLE